MNNPSSTLQQLKNALAEQQLQPAKALYKCLQQQLEAQDPILIQQGFELLNLEKQLASTPLEIFALLQSYDDYLRQYPNIAEVYHNRADVLRQQNLYQLALQDVERGLALKPDFPLAQCNKAFILNALGDYLEGWRLYEYRLQAGIGKLADDLPIPRWQGEELAQGKLLIYAEQGFGDNIQFVRYAMLAHAKGLNVVVVNHKPLEGLLNYNLALQGVPVSNNGAGIAGLHAYVSMMSLPHLFATELNNIPYPQAYLQAQPEFVQKWRQLVANQPAQPKIGLVWAGSPKHNRNGQRSLKLENLLPLFALPAQFHCLHKEVQAQDLAQALPNLHFWQDQIEDFSDTAALIEQLDLVISVDTSVAHLAAAMGKPTWILLSYHPDFRWLAEGEHSPWYQSVRLFRQGIDCQWQPLLQQLEQQLSQFLQEHLCNPTKQTSP